MARCVVVLQLVGAFSLYACVRATPPVVPSNPPLLTVVTWNLHGGRGDLRRFVSDLENGSVTGAPVDRFILLLQEFVAGGGTDATSYSAQRLSVFVGPVRGSRGNAIVSSVPLRETRAIELPRERQARGAISARVVLAGEELFVVCTHLENRLGWFRGLFADGARGRQADALLRIVPRQGAGVLGGDLNTMLGPDEPAWRALLARFPDTPGKPEPTFRNRLVLDHLFFDVPDGWRVTRRVVGPQYGSDHHPVVGEIRAG